MNMQQKFRKGISLIIVLAMMLTATVAATALYFVIQRYNAQSGSKLYSESSLAATKAGVAATTAWFTYEAPQVVNLVNTFLAQPSSSPRQAMKINLSAGYLASANLMHQSFDVYLVDVSADINKPISVKLQIVGKGQDATTAISTITLRLGGISYQRPPSASVPIIGNVGGKDALYLGNGQFETVQKPFTIVGSAYIQSSFKSNVNGKVTVKGDLVFGSNLVTYVQDSMTVSGNLYVGGAMYNTAPLTVSGNAYFNKQLTAVKGPVRIAGDAFFNDSIGDVSGAAGGGSGDKALSSTMWIGRNATFMKRVMIRSGGALTVVGDADFKGADRITVTATGSLTVNGNTDMYGEECFVQDGVTSFGTSTGNFLHTALNGGAYDTISYTGPTLAAPNCSYGYVKNPTYASTWDGYVSPASWTFPNTVTDADQLVSIRANIAAASTFKKAPFGLSDATINAKKIAWGSLFTNSTYTSWSSSCDALDASDNEWTNNTPRAKVIQCIIDQMPDSLKYNGYPVLDLSSCYFSSKAPSTEKISGKAIVIINSGTEYFPATTSTGRLLIYYRGTDADQVLGISGSGSDTCNCALYSKTGLAFSKGYFRGTTILDLSSTGRSYTSGTGSLTFDYNSSVLSDLASTGVMTDTNGVIIGSTPPSSSSVSTPYTISLLSPRLQVDVQSQVFGPTTVDTANAINFNRTLILVPSLISFTKNDFTSWSDLFAKFPVVGYVKPDSTGCGVLSTPSISGLDITHDTTYVIPYSRTCGGDVPSANLVVWVKPLATSAASGTSATGTSSSSSGVSSSFAASSSIAVSSSVVASSSGGAMGPGQFPYTFEDGTTQGWVSLSGSAAIDNTIFHAGSHSLKDVQIGAWSQVQTTFSTVENWVGYDSIVFWVYATSAGQSTQAFVTGSGLWQKLGGGSSTTLQTQNISQNAWTRLSWPLNASGLGSVSAFGLNIANAGTYYIDDVSLVVASMASSSSSSKANTPPYGGTCVIDLNTVVAGSTVTASTAHVWSDTTYQGANTIQFSFDGDTTWSTVTTKSWAAAGTHVVDSRAIDPNGLPSAVTNCGTVTVTGAPSGGCSTGATILSTCGNFNVTGAICIKHLGSISGWNASNTTGRTYRVNGGSWNSAGGFLGNQSAVSAMPDGYSYLDFSAGSYSYAACALW